MKWMFLLLAVLVLLAACTTTPQLDQNELRDCDQIGSEEECLANPSCETFYKPIFEAVSGTSEYARRDVYMNCAQIGALP